MEQMERMTQRRAGGFQSKENKSVCTGERECGGDRLQICLSLRLLLDQVKGGQEELNFTLQDAVFFYRSVWFSAPHESVL